MLVLCLEGCHGSGKTQLCSLFERAGFPVLDEVRVQFDLRAPPLVRSSHAREPPPAPSPQSAAILHVLLSTAAGGASWLPRTGEFGLVDR
jgi:hypothetical protein